MAAQSKTFSIQSVNPTVACLILTALTVVGVLISLGSKNPLWIILLMLPAVVYELYRTEPGASTKFSSILLLVILILEIGLLVFGIHYDLAKFLNTDQQYIAGYSIPLGDVQIFGPLVTAILSAILVFRTYGTYTKWLSVIIALGSLVAVYIINPVFFQEALKLIIRGLFNQLSYSI
ncbi:hypothetical protein M1563_01605 [Patescibacteria group bacterium]|nr:hypothetical protein [Patescibacteria group bacterium]